ncbi:DUF305 domain-containing protein [Nostoc sp.]|uniref:DUF305 domain-containing protein n=1 Tax=Nostoc sp. TaxID=1180 RepID=UPI0035944AA5
MNKKPLTYCLIGLLTGSVITAGVLFLVAKSSPSPAGIASLVPFRPGMIGQSDQHFIVMMIPHHEGAIAMADLALSKAKHPEIKKLAEAIKTTQSQEIQQMQTWYKQWSGADVPAWGPGNRWGWYNRNQQGQGSNQQPVWGPGMGMYRNWNDWDRNGGSGMMGGNMMGGNMMGTNLYTLQKSPDFDREFIQQMIPHHQMGVMMASMVFNSSQRPEIRNLSQLIIKGQTAEINQMQQWYQQWYQ